MFAALLFACLLPAPPETAPPETAPDVEALPAAAAAGGSRGEEAFAALVEFAGDWGDLRTQDRSTPAAEALRALADGTGPIAERAADALADRRVAILTDLRERGFANPSGRCPPLECGTRWGCP